jgi:hypothetical protein
LLAPPARSGSGRTSDPLTASAESVLAEELVHRCLRHGEATIGETLAQLAAAERRVQHRQGQQHLQLVRRCRSAAAGGVVLGVNASTP